jgi:uncharacterized RDD family membrane protein YckC
MSLQPPDKDGPPGPTDPGSDAETPSPDEQTTRVPIETGDEPVPPPATPGLISANPVGWSDPSAAPTGTPSAGDPAVPWAPPVQPVAAQVVDGLVISGTFSRVVAYAIDVLFLGLLNLAALGALDVVTGGGDDTVTIAASAVLIGVDCLYFVGLWTSGWHATLGMRLLRLRILTAATAGTLSINDALLRWIALSGAVAILALLPRVAGTVGVLSFIWLVVLLITTATHPLHQGLHDRWARSVVVQPAPGGSGAAVVTCLVLLVIIFVVVPIALVVVAGPQLEDILRQIGESI